MTGVDTRAPHEPGTRLRTKLCTPPGRRFEFLFLRWPLLNPSGSRVRRWKIASHELPRAVPESDSSRWQLEYESAIQETDHKVLFKRIEVAEAAILSRREILMQSSDGFAERQETKMALAKLRNLKKEVLKFL